MTALWLLAQRVIAALTGRAGLAVTGAAAAADIGPFGGDGFRLFGGGQPSRRRRRRALTASDKADIGFIAGVLGKPAGRDFAMIIAARR